jgi:Kinesin motor domain
VYILRCSYFEIYNDALYDLLNPHKELAFSEPLTLQEDIRKREFIVRGLKEYVVESYEECVRRVGEFHRHYAETRMNH